MYIYKFPTVMRSIMMNRSCTKKTKQNKKTLKVQKMSLSYISQPFLKAVNPTLSYYSEADF